MTGNETYLDLAVGPYALALAARAVVSIQQQVPLAPTLAIRESQAPMCDLGEVFTGNRRAEAPFVIVLEAEGAMAAVAVDWVGQLRHRDPPLVRHVPAFGLIVPDLYAGGIRDGDRLLLILVPAALIALTHDRARSI